VTEILHVFGPEFLERGYKIQLDSDHVAKFQGGRSRDLGERAAKKRTWVKYEARRKLTFRAA